MAEQSFKSRMGAKLVPSFANRMFPPEWLAAGDDRDQLRAIAKKRRSGDGPRPDVVLQRKWGRATTEIGGRRLHLLTPKGGSTGRVLFHCHGGAFVVGPSSVEWLFAAKFAASLGCDLALYDYPKVPEYDSSSILATTLEAYRTINTRYDASDIIMSGTSAGGGLAVATMMQLQQADQPIPSAAALFSPLLDMTLGHPDIPMYVDSDLMLAPDNLRRDGELYAGSSELTDPLVSPRFASDDQLAALPPIIVTAGEQEILRPEAEEFVDRLNRVGGTASLHLEAYGQHAAVLVGTNEGKTTLDAARHALRKSLTAAQTN